MIAGAWDPNEAPFTELQEAGFLCLDHMANDPSSQILGISLLVDYKEFSLSKLFAFNFGIGKLVMEYLQVRTAKYWTVDAQFMLTKMG